jgi:hypothetical protein
VVTDDKGGFLFSVFLDDEIGHYVYFVEIDFSADIPNPAWWYTIATWPNLRIIDGAVTVNCD